MKLEEIYTEWDVDSDIDTTDLGNESIKIPKLHNKYYKLFSSEKLLLRKYEAEMKPCNKQCLLTHLQYQNLCLEIRLELLHC